MVKTVSAMDKQRVGAFSIYGQLDMAAPAYPRSAPDRTDSGLIVMIPEMTVQRHRMVMSSPMIINAKPTAKFHGPSSFMNRIFSEAM